MRTNKERTLVYKENTEKKDIWLDNMMTASGILIAEGLENHLSKTVRQRIKQNWQMPSENQEQQRRQLETKMDVDNESVIDQPTDRTWHGNR